MQAAKLHSLMVATLRKGPIDAATHNEWRSQSMTSLREKYGDAYEAKLEPAAEFVRNRPGLATIMRSGLGSHPDVVMVLAANAHNLRMKPRARKVTRGWSAQRTVLRHCGAGVGERHFLEFC